MFIVGIDIAKRNHEAMIIDEEGRIITKPFSFSNNCTGFNKLVDAIRKVTLDRNQFSIGLESTAHYWLPLYIRLVKMGYAVHVINPIQSDSLRSMYIRKTKTDSRDCFIIAEVIRFGRYSETKVPAEKMFAFRELCRNRFFIVDQISDLKRKIIALVDQVFPEYETLFSSHFVKTSIALLSKYPTPESIVRANKNSLIRLIYTSSGGHFGTGKAIEIRDLAKESFGVSDSYGVFAALIKTYIEHIKLIQKQLDEIDKLIKEIFDTFESPITTIAGIGDTLGAVILSEIGDIRKFSSADKLYAFSGMDPSIRQSGNFIGTKNHMSKRGSPYLRRAIWMASVIAVQFDPMFKTYYEKKLSEGKKYMVTMGHVSKKMTTVIYAVLRDNKAYQPVLKSA